MTSKTKHNWLAPAGLVALTIVPALAGSMRVWELSNDAAITADNARFFVAPLPVILHIAGSLIYCLLGALQLSRPFHQRYPRWHRLVGPWLLLCGLTAALSGLWMNQFYPPAEFDGPALYVIRWIVGFAMTGMLFLAYAAIRRWDIPQHRAWMIRAYALGLGAGTQVITHLPWILVPSMHSESTRVLLMASGWMINVLVAEWVIARGYGGLSSMGKKKLGY